MRVPSRVGWALAWWLVGCGGTTTVPAQAPQPEPAPATQAPAGASAAETQDRADVPASAEAPGGQDALEHSELTDAERSLAEADRELERLARSTEAGGDSRADGEAAVPQRRSRARQQRCQTTCQAFSSLERARDAICRIDGERGERCARARAIVKRHTASRDSCGCGN